MKQINKITLALAIASITTIAHAGFVGVADPLSWDRGDAASGFLEFDDFVGITGVSTSTANGGGLTGTISQFAPIAPPGGLFGTSPDTRLYVHSSAVSWTLSSSSSAFDVNFLELQIKESAGDGLGSLAVFANGEAADSVTVYGDGNSNAITRFYWALDSTIATGTAFDITVAGGPFSFDSYDSFSIDAAAVPVPAAAWLFGSALVGLGAIRRKS